MNTNNVQAYTDLFGLKIFNDEPEINVRKNVLYIPRDLNLTDLDKSFGLYDRYGRLISDAGPRREWPNHAVGQSDVSCIDPSGRHDVAPRGDYFYGGHVGTHFGHFIAETLPRYWCEKKFFHNKKIVIHSSYNIDEIFSSYFIKKFFSYLDLCKDNFVIFKRPTIIPNIIISGTSFEENHFAHNVFASFCNKIGRDFGVNNLNDKPVYLSRSQFGSGMRVFESESILEENLKNKGFNIVHPQKLTLEEQISLFSTTRPVCGFIGSAFHNSIFSSFPIGVALCPNGNYSSNFFLMDEINRSQISYVRTPYLHQKSSQAHFSIDDPKKMSEFLDEMVSGKVWEHKKSYKLPENFEENFCLPPMKIKTIHGSFLGTQQHTGIVHAQCFDNKLDDLIFSYKHKNDPVVFLVNKRNQCLTINYDNRCSNIVSYISIPHEKGFFLLNSETNRFLSAEPNGEIKCDRLEPSDWELFEFID
ncbi:glycosyltransferase 61 family protein [Neokomagataea anthophila]|uniref:Glycosyltransferase family 61 protein n=1 Tax=Neokomagataea anthophila TaxID=2826925 RepID=A0ABS5E4Q4_9PROT|nr:glycosyltransferase 61 family protein [Neokomagataea anthophila]MBR0558872.1 glycosyltransferase family 61 protein [Neokomagataea anthophila]